MLDLSYIYGEFKKIADLNEKVKYIQSLSQMGLPYEINYENLVSVWEKQAEKANETSDLEEA